MTAEGGLFAALADVQAELPPITKGETAQVKSDKANYTYKYADLAAVSAVILPVLGKHGLAFTARPTLLDGHFVLAYSLLHSSGERLDGEYPLSSGSSATPQQIGSLITYARRYCLCAVTGVAPAGEDDDAASANTPQRWGSSAGDAFDRASPARPANGNGHGAAKASEVRAVVLIPETDIDWMGHLVDDLIPAASTREELTGFWTNVAEHAKAGTCTAEHAQQIRAMVTERSRELGLEKAATP